MMDKLLIIITFFISTATFAQQSIDGSFDFQSDPEKKYSLYVPSSYNENESNGLMVGLHPRNTSRWDSQSWRDTLIQFAEHNQLILACPDGGPDGAIDDDIDTAFTSVLIDSMSLWFNIDESQKYLMGFSWGGKTVYSYGLRRVDEFAGFIPIGAAISGGSEIENLSPNALGKKFYIVHGSNDNPNNTFTPAVDQLTSAAACLETNLISGVGHTIDFPNRNEVLTTAFEYVRDFNCLSANEDLLPKSNLYTSPNPSLNSFFIHELEENSKVKCYDIDGRQIANERTGNSISITEPFKGLLLIQIKRNNKTTVIKQFIK